MSVQVTHKLSGIFVKVFYINLGDVRQNTDVTDVVTSVKAPVAHAHKLCVARVSRVSRVRVRRT